jgi:hypothetical protein
LIIKYRTRALQRWVAGGQPGKPHIKMQQSRKDEVQRRLK